MFNPDKYLSVVWQMGGRSFPVLDCYGLVHEVRKDLGLTEWPLFEGVINQDRQMNDACNSHRNNVQQCEASEGVVAVCYSSGLVTHLGVVVCIDGVLMVMECNPRRNVTVFPLARFIRQYVKVEFYQ